VFVALLAFVLILFAGFTGIGALMGTIAISGLPPWAPSAKTTAQNAHPGSATSTPRAALSSGGDGIRTRGPYVANVAPLPR
jgi:hypothetical protein